MHDAVGCRHEVFAEGACWALTTEVSATIETVAENLKLMISLGNSFSRATLGTGGTVAAKAADPPITILSFLMRHIATFDLAQ